MLRRAYRFALLKVLSWSAPRDIREFSSSAVVDMAPELSRINSQFLRDQVEAQVDRGTTLLAKRKWFLRIYGVAFLANIMACLYRPFGYFDLRVPLAEPLLLSVVLVTLFVVMWGASQMYESCKSMLNEPAPLSGQDCFARDAQYKQDQEYRQFEINFLCASTISLLTLTLLPGMGTVGIIPACLLTIYCAVQRMSRNVIHDDMPADQFNDYLQRTQQYYPGSVRDDIFFRQLEGASVTMSYLMLKQVNPDMEKNHEL